MNRHHPRGSLLLLGAGVCLLAGCASNVAQTPFEYAMAETFVLPASGSIRLTSEDARVSIIGADREDVRIEARYVLSAAPEQLKDFAYRLHVAEADGQLVVTEERHTGRQNFIYRQHVHDITIEVPRNARVTIREEDGTCMIRGLSGPVHLTMDDGTIRLENCSGNISVAMDNARLSQRDCATVQLVRR